jgi:uncharacterized spore protein YtfJ
MDVQEMISRAEDSITVKRVFGEPYEKGGIVFIPAARVMGGGGGGGGRGSDGEGSGGGFGLAGQPVGAYVLSNGSVSWKPALDLTSIIVRAQSIALVALLTARAIRRRRGRSRAR